MSHSFVNNATRATLHHSSDNKTPPDRATNIPRQRRQTRPSGRAAQQPFQPSLLTCGRRCGRTREPSPGGSPTHPSPAARAASGRRATPTRTVPRSPCEHEHDNMRTMLCQGRRMATCRGAIRPDPAVGWLGCWHGQRNAAAPGLVHGEDLSCACCARSESTRTRRSCRLNSEKGMLPTGPSGS